MNLLRLSGVTGVRGGRVLFRDLSLGLEPGGAALVTGANGAGKSSLLRMIAGLLPAAMGTVEATPAALADARLSLDEELPLRAALDWWARLDGTGAALDAVMARWALGALAEVPVRLLSTGQRQRARLARVALAGRALWLLDEPANGLDAASTAILDAEIARHRAQGGAAVVASHVPVALPGAVQVAL